ncbi:MULTISPECIES: DUF4142 domain-containing protein [Fischerella]|uniref:DUF4142 domain-containing protein n=1 Tax=Fischerella TaxID=1190 RepID=UPI0003040F9E|nr:MULTISPECIES: DUF4142 domain-containing protein [Fischerella]MBD2430939.1 DUF4142 domain-containing protein [Fischerella sp. FACHB-380]
MLKKIVVAIVLVAVGLFTSLGYSAFAQKSQPTSVPSNQINAIDRQYMINAAEAGIANIMLGELALQRATNPEVKQFAQAEIDEQQQVKSELTRIAPQVKVTLPTVPGAKYQAIMTQLKQLSDEQFNRAYMDEGGVNAHLENAATFQREAQFGQNPALLALVNKGLPIIERHFKTASTLTDYRFAQVAQRFNGNSGTSRSNTTPTNP